MRKDLSRLMFSAAIALASVTAAYAYSDEAIRDADEVLRATTKRFEFGEVLKPDVALARYNLIEMQLKAGKLEAAAFCKTAKPELELVAAAFDPPDGKADDKTKWAAAAAAMDSDPAKCREATAIADQLLFDERPTDYSDAALKEARAFVLATAQRLATGDVTAVDVASARYALLEVKHGAKALAHTAFCQTGVPVLREVADGTEQEAGIGQRSLADNIAAKRRLGAATAQCAGELHGDVKEVVSRSRKAESELVRKDFDGALADFNAVLQLAPQNTSALRGRGLAYAGKNDREHAEADFTAALGLDASDADTLQARGELRYDNNNPDGAIADYTALLALDPDNLEGRLYRAGALRLKNDFTGAIADYTYVVEHGPSNDVMFRFGTLKFTLEQRAASYQAAHNLDGALADLTELLGIKRGDPDTLRRRADVYLAKMDYNRAIADYTAILALDPKNVAVLVQRGAAYELIKDYERGIADNSEAIRLDPKNADAFNERCWLRAIGGHLADALPDCDESLRQRPGDANTLDSRGFVHLARGELDAALADYDAALRTEPKLASSLYGRSVARRRKGDGAGADVDVAAAKVIDPAIAEKFVGYGLK
jgi:tetratricopeptide (TPR) repeat protein